MTGVLKPAPQGADTEDMHVSHGTMHCSSGIQQPSVCITSSLAFQFEAGATTQTSLMTRLASTSFMAL